MRARRATASVTSVLGAAALAACAVLAPSRPAAAQSIMVTGGGMPGMGSGPMVYTGPDAVHVHIEGNGALYEESTNGWQPVCMIPCTTDVSPHGNFKLGGLMAKDSDPFQFPQGRPLELMAHTASSLDFGNQILGWTLLSLAPAPIVLGALFAGGTFEGDGPATTTDRIVGSAIIAGGVALLAVSIYVLLDTPKTTLTTADGQRLARRPSLDSVPSLHLSHAVALTPSGLVF
jgi:hypothetical protein